jgi:hypothetical protein
MAAPNLKTVDEIDAAMADILSLDEFRASSVEVSGFTRGIGEIFQDVIRIAQHWLSQISDIHPGVFLALTMITGLALFFAAWWGLKMSRVGKMSVLSSDFSSASSRVLESPVKLRSQAKNCAEGKDYLQAIRLLFRAFVFEWEGQVLLPSGSLNHASSKTYLEYLDAFSRSATLDPELAILFKTMERGLYGQQTLEFSDYQDACRILKKPVA